MSMKLKKKRKLAQKIVIDYYSTIEILILGVSN